MVLFLYVEVVLVYVLCDEESGFYRAWIQCDDENDKSVPWV
jgi:hypothetical protein